MITLEKGNKLINEPHLEVYNSGEYKNNDLVLVNKIGETVPTYQYIAYYIKFGMIEDEINL
jgi:hypothetical protein